METIAWPFSLSAHLSPSSSTFHFGRRNGGGVGHDLREVRPRTGHRDLEGPVVDRLGTEIVAGRHFAIQWIVGVVDSRTGVELLGVLDVEEEAGVCGLGLRIKLAAPGIDEVAGSDRGSVAPALVVRADVEGPNRRVRVRLERLGPVGDGFEVLVEL